jgi:hypothetical protein
MRTYRFFIILFVLFYACGALSDYVEKLPGNYYFIFESQYNQTITGHGSIIPTVVISYSYNDNYILAAQRTDLTKDSNVDGVNNVDVVQFWIIDVKKETLYGPFKIAEYLEKRKILNIPGKLKLKVEL